MKANKNIHFESILIDQNENGEWVMRIAFHTIDDLKLTLAPAVLIPLVEAMLNAAELQIEIDKLLPTEQASFPLEVATRVIRGSGWFKALGSQALIAQRFNGMFGADPARKDN